jgi:hypothetical protein
MYFLEKIRAFYRKYTEKVVATLKRLLTPPVVFIKKLAKTLWKPLKRYIRAVNTLLKKCDLGAQNVLLRISFFVSELMLRLKEVALEIRKQNPL